MFTYIPDESNQSIKCSQHPKTKQETDTFREGKNGEPGQIPSPFTLLVYRDQHKYQKQSNYPTKKPDEQQKARS